MQDYSQSFYSFSYSNVVVDRLKLVHLTTNCIGIEYCQNYVKKCRRYLRQYSTSIADTIGSNTNTVILPTLHRPRTPYAKFGLCGGVTPISARWSCPSCCLFFYFFTFYFLHQNV